MNVNDTLTGKTVKVELAGTDFYIHLIDNAEGELEELRITSSRRDSDLRALMTAVSELFSLCIMYKVPLKDIVDRLSFIRSETSGFTGHSDIKSAMSIVDFIAKYINLHYMGDRNGDT